MIARSESGIVLVSGTLPGERVTARVERVKKGVVFAETVSVDGADADRREPFTDPLCGGCLYAHIAYPRQLAIKAQVIADALARIGRIPLAAAVQVTPSREDGYRMRARLHVRDGRIGFYREGSHELCDARATRQLLAPTSDLLDDVAARLRSVSADGVRELEVSESNDASQRVVHLEATGQVDRAALHTLGGTAGLTGLTMTPAEVLAGDPYLTDRFDVAGRQVTLRRHVLSFSQGNRYLLGDLVRHVVEPVNRGDRVIDLYAGTGLFSVAAAAAGASVTAVEGDRFAASDLKINAATSEGAIDAVHEAVEGYVTRYRPSAQAPAMLVVDPPRTGMSKEALDGLTRMRVRRIVYVSCDVATFARDARRLLDAGYVMGSVTGFDLFPNTPHVETVGSFTS